MSCRTFVSAYIARPAHRALTQRLWARLTRSSHSLFLEWPPGNPGRFTGINDVAAMSSCEKFAADYGAGLSELRDATELVQARFDQRLPPVSGTAGMREPKPPSAGRHDILRFRAVP